jgi:hypothetical protein
VEALGVPWEEFLRFQQRSARLSPQQLQIASYLWSLQKQEEGGDACAWDSGNKWWALETHQLGWYASGAPGTMLLPQEGDCWIDYTDPWCMPGQLALGEAENQLTLTRT